MERSKKITVYGRNGRFPLDNNTRVKFLLTHNLERIGFPKKQEVRFMSRKGVVRRRCKNNKVVGRTRLVNG